MESYVPGSQVDGPFMNHDLSLCAYYKAVDLVCASKQSKLCVYQSVFQ